MFTENEYTLAEMIMAGQREAITDFLWTTNVRYNAQNSDGDTLLHIALRHCPQSWLINKLIETPLNLTNHQGETPLHLAAADYQEDAPKNLFNLLFEPRTVSEHMLTLQSLRLNSNVAPNYRLIATLRANYRQGTRRLLSNVNLPDRNRNTPGDIVINRNSNRVDCLLLILAAGADITPSMIHASKALPYTEAVLKVYNFWSIWDNIPDATEIKQIFIKLYINALLDQNTEFNKDNHNYVFMEVISETGFFNPVDIAQALCETRITTIPDLTGRISNIDDSELSHDDSDHSDDSDDSELSHHGSDHSESSHYKFLKNISKTLVNLQPIYLRYQRPVSMATTMQQFGATNFSRNSNQAPPPANPVAMSGYTFPGGGTLPFFNPTLSQLGVTHFSGVGNQTPPANPSQTPTIPFHGQPQQFAYNPNV